MTLKKLNEFNPSPVQYIYIALWCLILSYAIYRSFSMISNLNLIVYSMSYSVFNLKNWILYLFLVIAVAFLLIKKNKADNILLSKLNAACCPLLLIIPEFFFKISFFTPLIFIIVTSYVTARALRAFDVNYSFIYHAKYKTMFFAALIGFMILVAYGWYIQCQAVKVMYLPWTDWGYIWNSMYNTFHGKFFYCNFLRLNHLGIHFSPTLLLLSPVVWLFPSHEAFFMMNSIIIFSGALILFWLSRVLRLSAIEAFLISMMFLLNAGIFNLNMTNLYSFHEINLIFPVLFLCFICYEKKKFIPLILLVILSFFIKETVAVLWAGIGITMLIRRKYKTGIILTLFSIIYFFIALKLVMPAIIDSPHYSQGFRFNNLGNSYFEVLLSPIMKPTAFFESLFRKGNLIFIISLFLPFVLVVFARPVLIIPAIPILLFICLQSSNQLQNIVMQYQCMPSAVLFIAFCYSYRSIKIKSTRIYKKLLCGFNNSHKTATSVLLASLSATIISWCFFAQTHFSKYNIARTLNSTDCTPYIDKFKAEIPKDAPILVSERVAPHFCGRNPVYFQMADSSKCDYILLDMSDVFFGENARKIRKQILKDAIYKPVKSISFDRHTLVLYRKNAPNDLQLKHENIISSPLNFNIQVPLKNKDFYLYATIIGNEIIFCLTNLKKIDCDVVIYVAMGNESKMEVKSRMYGNGFMPAYLAPPNNRFYFKFMLSDDISPINQINAKLKRLPY